MKILYFTSTGNNLYIAKSIAKSFDGETLSIVKLLANRQYEIEDDIVGIVLPVYFSDIPDLVDEYLKRVKIKADYIFSITTYGGHSFNAKSEINRYNFNVDYTEELMMGDNYIPMYDMKKESNKEINYEKISEITTNIKNRVKFNKRNPAVRALASIITKFTKRIVKDHDKNFTVTSDCILCNKCAQICPVNNININEKVNFKGDCIACMGCIHICPTIAIQHDKQKNNARYKNKHVTIEELIDTSN